MTYTRIFKHKNIELCIHRGELTDDLLYELKIDGVTNSIGFGTLFDDGWDKTNKAVARFHSLTQEQYFDELKKIKKSFKENKQ